ncbi:hypothetical protein ACYSNW_07270 [Enterococcus sp. LJL99]
MKKITEKNLLTLVDQREQRFVCLIDDRFFYIERGHIYRFESHHNMKLLDCFDEFEAGNVPETVLIKELQQTLIKQIQYDWLTDVMKETFFDQAHRFSDMLIVFFL